MSQEITAFSEDEARRLIAQWRAKADVFKQQAETMSKFASLSLIMSETMLRDSADQLEAILPKGKDAK